MDRRDFCRFAGVCTLAACAGGLSGCARLLDWSQTSDRAVTREIAGGGGSAAPGAPSTATAEATPTAPASPPAKPAPDLAVARGSEDPAANVRAAIAALGGMGAFVKRGDDVAIKPNILTGRPPEFATTTNPTVMAELVKLAWDAGAKSVTVFDRPTSSAPQAYAVCGIAKAVNDVDGRMKVLSDRDFERVDIPEGRVLSDWPLVADVFDADVFINVPIAKTHGLAGLTLSMKNLMGIMGGARGTVHQEFDQKIIDVNSLVRPHLIVLDAYRMLIRNGPTGGSLADVKTVKTCVAGTNAISVDAYGATLFGWQPTDLTYVRTAANQGLGVADLSKLTIAEETL